MRKDQYRLLLGTVGWLHDDWQNSFYPEDLPEEWKLGFYANEFPVVVFPASMLEELDMETLSDWLEGCEEGFAVLCECPDNATESQVEKLKKVVDVLNEYCLGIIFDWPEQGIVAVENIRSMFTDDLPLAVSVPDDKVVTDEECAQLANINASLVWNGKGEPILIKDSKLLVTRVQAGELKLPELGKLVAGCLGVDSSALTSVLVMDGFPPSIDLLEKAEVILDLM